MIFYFSATGNSKHVAESIAQDGELLVPISQATDNGEFSYRVTDSRVGVVSPTYNWTIPSIVSDFLCKLALIFNEKPYIYFVATYGTTSGAASAMANSILKKHGLAFDAMFDIKMPDTWTPIFDLSDPNHVKSINDHAEVEIAALKKQIADKVRGKHMSLTMPMLAGKIGQHIYNKTTRNTSNLSVTSKCIGCGLCAKKCPAHAIEMQSKKPVWIHPQCIMCLGCLHRCPKFAIQCGKNTEKHGQYLNPYTKV